MKRVGAVLELLYGILGVILGAGLLFAEGATVLNWIVKLVGIFMLVHNVIKLVIVLGINVKCGRGEMTVYLSGAVIGAIVLFLPAAAVAIGSVLAGVWFVVLPIVDIVRAEYRSEQFRAELPKLVIGASLLILGPTVLFSLLVKIIGGAILFFSGVYLVKLIYRLTK